jgi:hypothetical protein
MKECNDMVRPSVGKAAGATLLISFVCIVIITAPFSASSAIQKQNGPTQHGNPVIWRDPGDVAKLDFAAGPGGREKAPKPPFAFIDEVSSGPNPAVVVTDAAGVKWSVEFGPEINAEIFATRIAWAAGYFVEPLYFVASGTIDDLGEIKRAKAHIKRDGRFTNARFERRREKGVLSLDDADSWSWVQNPFAGSRELNGLKAIMMLVSNWDNKDARDGTRGSNTAILRTPQSGGAEDRYLVDDWRSSMGKWGGYLKRGRWDCKGFTQQTPGFVKGVMGDIFVWGYSGHYTRDFSDDIRISDMRWLMQYLGRITDEQLREGLQASGANAAEVDCFARAIRERINQIKSCIE